MIILNLTSFQAYKSSLTPIKTNLSFLFIFTLKLETLLDLKSLVHLTMFFIIKTYLGEPLG